MRDGLLDILGDDLIALWAHGGTLASPEWRGADLDTYAILVRRPDAATVQAIKRLHDAIEEDLGVEWDAWYVTAADAAEADPPSHAFSDERRDTSWAIHRAHWLAGRVWVLHGKPPGEVVATPAWPEIVAELDRELLELWMVNDREQIRDAGLDPDGLLAATDREVPGATPRTEALVDWFLTDILVN